MDLINEVDSQLNSNFEDVKNLNFLLLISGGVDSVVLLDLLIKSKSVKTKIYICFIVIMEFIKIAMKLKNYVKCLLKRMI